MRAVAKRFGLWAGPGQVPPHDSWSTWIFLGGRGAGKTRAGAEWVQNAVATGVAKRIALVGQAMHDVREVMIEGASGICRSGAVAPTYESSRRRLSWPNGAIAFAFSAEDPEALRGPQFDAAWIDELCAWPRAAEALTTLRLGLRLGERPRLVVTTTPRPIKPLVALCAERTSVVTHARTADNASNLAPGFVDQMTDLWGGTRYGRQELEGELLDAPEGALWSSPQLAALTFAARPVFDDVVVAVDPPASVGPNADWCGIVAAGSWLADGVRRAMVLEDASVQGCAPQVWAQRVHEAARRWGARRIVAEANQGGEMVRTVLQLDDPEAPVRLVHAAASKTARAQPIAALYDKGVVRHAPGLTALEEQMCAFGAGALGGSPDRVDALVWALTDLLVSRASPSLRAL